jgi:hypothetical protein
VKSTVRWGRFAVGVDADHGGAAVFPPAVGGAHFDRHAGQTFGQHALLVFGVLAVKHIGAGHGDHAHTDLAFGQQFLRGQSQLHLRTGGDDHAVGLLDADVLGLGQHIRATADVAQVALG